MVTDLWFILAQLTTVELQASNVIGNLVVKMDPDTGAVEKNAKMSG